MKGCVEDCVSDLAKIKSPGNRFVPNVEGAVRFLRLYVTTDPFVEKAVRLNYIDIGASRLINELQDEMVLC